MDEDTGSGTRMTLLDRKWSRGHAVMMFTATAPRPAPQVRDLFSAFVERHPTHPLACRIDRRRHRWVPVGAADRAAVVDRLVVATGEPSSDGHEPYLRAQIAGLAPDLPFRMAISEHTIFVIMSHAIGDAVTLGALVAALLLPELTPAHRVVDRLAAVEPRMRLASAAPELVRGLPRHGRDWIAHAPHPTRRLTRRLARQPGTPPPTRPPGPPRPAFTGTVVPNEHVRAVTRWRNQHSPGTGITALWTSAAYRALAANGVEIDPHGYYAIFDLRPFLPSTSRLECGNMVKSLHLAAQLDDPSSVDEALRRANSARRVLPAFVLGTAMRRRRSPAVDRGRAAPLTLTFTVMPAFAGLSQLARVGPGDRRLYAFGTPTGPGGIAISMVRLREHMQVMASFDETTVPLAKITSTLAGLTDPCALLGSC